MTTFFLEYIFQYWYISIITALFSIIAPRTKYRWAPLTCITLILLIPEFRPPSSLGIYAIAITTIVDVQLIYMTLRGLPKTSLNLMLIKDKQVALSMIFGLVLGGVILYHWGCRVGLIGFVAAAVTLSTALFILEKSSSKKKANPVEKVTILEQISLFATASVLIVSSFGLPLLIILRKIEGRSHIWHEEFVSAFNGLFLITIIAAILDTSIALFKFGIYSFPYPALMFALIGAFTGRVVLGFTWPVKESPIAFHGYQILLLFLSALSLYYIFTKVI